MSNLGARKCTVLNQMNRPNFPSDIARDGLSMEMMEMGWRASRIPLACWATNSWWKGSKTPVVLERVKAFYRKGPTSYRLICKWLTGNYSGYRSMDGWMDGWMDGCMHAWMDGCMHACMHGWMDGWMHAWMDGWMDGCMHGWMHACMDGWMDACMHGWMDGWIHG